MDSPHFGVACVEHVEGAARWPTYTHNMYDVSQNNYQNFNGVNYPDWGTMPFSDNRRLHKIRAKPHHKRNHQQPSWSAKGPPAPASPQWQPQPPPPASPPTDPQGPVAVNVYGLPYALCRQNFLEAMLDQAGLADDIMGCVLGEEQDTGNAVIYLANHNAALKCVQHFDGRRWDNTGPPVTAKVAEAGPSVTAQVAVGEEQPAAMTRGPHKPRGVGNGHDQNMMPAPLPFAVVAAPLGSWMMPPPALPFMAYPDAMEYQKGSDLSPEMAGHTSPEAVSNGSNSPKVCWADVADKGEEENSLSEGLEGSTSAGSTGRNHTGGESFFVGCDVDTDDGF